MLPARRGLKRRRDPGLKQERSERKEREVMCRTVYSGPGEPNEAGSCGVAIKTSESQPRKLER